MTVILAIAGAAIAAVTAFNRQREAEPQAAEVTVTSIRQSTSVVLAFGGAVMAVLDALLLLTGKRQQQGSSTTPLRTMGVTASDVDP